MTPDYTRHYLRFHDDSPEHEAVMADYYARLLGSHLPREKGASILDVGCGMGFALLTLKGLGYTRCTGVERDPQQAAACKARGLEIETTDDTVAFLQRQPGQYDMILLLDVLEHIAKPQQLDFAAAMCSALRPGGTLVCTVPNASSGLSGHWRYNDWTHECSFTTDSLDFVLFNGGFTDIRVCSSDMGEPSRGWWWRWNGTAQFWIAFRLVRLWRRIEMMVELSPKTGRRIPLSLNLLGVARRP